MTSVTTRLKDLRLFFLRLLGTNQVSTPTASTIVFNMPEILEMILDYAGLLDLLVWQRVNRLFKAAIQRSPFQRKLFMESDVEWIDSEHLTQCFELNPFLGRIGISLDWDQGMCYFRMPLNLSPVSKAIGASWRRMYIAKPVFSENYAGHSANYMCGLKLGYVVDLPPDAKYDNIPICKRIHYGMMFTHLPMADADIDT